MINAANYRQKAKAELKKKALMAAWIDSSTQLLHPVDSSRLIVQCQLHTDVAQLNHLGMFLQQVNNLNLLSGFFSFLMRKSLMKCDFSPDNKVQVLSLMFTLTMRDVCFTTSKERTMGSFSGLGWASFGHRYTNLGKYSVSVHWVCDNITVCWYEVLTAISNPV